MPTQVHTRPQHDRIVSPHHVHDPHSMAEHDLANKNALHREALRLALGSILAPKRNCSHSPGSRSGSTSGTASPAHPWHFPSGPSSTSPLGTPVPPPPPHPSPSQHAQAPQSHVHSHLHPHSMYPSRFGLPRSNSEELVTSRNHVAEPTISEEGPSLPHTPSRHVGGLELVPQSTEGMAPSQHSQMTSPSISVSPPTIHAPAPKSHSELPTSATMTANEDGHEAHVGSGTPKAKWIETLQSKRAWDALIHGSFS